MICSGHTKYFDFETRIKLISNISNLRSITNKKHFNPKNKEKSLYVTDIFFM